VKGGNKRNDSTMEMVASSRAGTSLINPTGSNRERRSRANEMEGKVGKNRAISTLTCGLAAADWWRRTLVRSAQWGFGAVQRTVQDARTPNLFLRSCRTFRAAPGLNG
jgi:hypothetical protein